ncbi:flagellar biosynthesis regulatory protein FlaF [Arsenicitalea aurantiaca]|uniref:Flagellar biosynthesis regulatory protein FlaF n=2 Tax=Arsenicitalea aurantiaca TaxID=1783274 RepID=A0A433XGH7_9HYPH|nr:flagellar biosynthesis regulatory protein FlaF [Arsenicitalea aurantiaca]
MQAYQQVARRTTNPRDLEANLLSRSASNLQRIREDWEKSQSELNAALVFNSKLWRVFLGSVTRADNPLPAAIRQNVANLGVFVMNQTMKLEARPEPAKLDVLITINRELAAGLRAAANPPA